MKILIVSHSDISGGAAKAAYRLHKGLMNSSIDSQMIVSRKNTDDFTVLGPETNFQKTLAIFLPVIEKFITDLLGRFKKGMFSPGFIRSSKIIKRINLLKPDVVHLHWTNGGMIRIEDIKKINSPIVWSLQDMWAFTGGCHFNNDCNGYQNKCGSCKTLSSKFKYDLSSIVYFRKKKTFKKINKLIINGPSKWMSECAKKSSLFNKNIIINLPNTIDTNLFRPIDKNISRKLFGIPDGKKVILFGASNVNDPRKGYAYLLSALSKLNIKDLILVVAGQSKPKNPIKTKYPVYYIPPVSDDVSLVQMYNVADLVLMPSLEDNLPNTVMESLSCAVPVVAFDIGGHSDLIDHKKNGYLALEKDASDFAEGINWVLNNKEISLSNNAREKVLNTFSYSVVVKRYIKLYKDILSNQI